MAEDIMHRAGYEALIAHLEAHATGLELAVRKRHASAAELEREITRARDQRAHILAEAEETAAQARVVRQELAQLTGRTAVLAPDDVTVDGLELRIGGSRLAPSDASEAALNRYRALMQAINAQSLHASALAADRVRAMQATLTTGELAPEDLPQPDPLTASPAEESGAHPTVTAPDAPGWLPSAGPTPDAVAAAPEQLDEVVEERRVSGLALYERPEYPTVPVVGQAPARRVVRAIAGFLGPGEQDGGEGRG